MNTKLFLVFLLPFNIVLAQDSYQNRVKAELTEWDAARGEWLSESFQAMATNQPIPDRTFPEDLTPAEMYSLVPSDRRDRINAILAESNQPAPTSSERVPQSTGSSSQTRIPVGTPNPTTPPPTYQDAYNRYNYYASRPNCGLTSGRSYGDPHIRTFDGKSYSFQTVGEYILSSSPDRSFEVQARQRPQTDKVSLNTATAMNVYGDRVGIYASDFPDAQTGTPLRVNGRPVYLNNETFFLPHGGTVQNKGREYIVTWPTGEKVLAKMTSSGSMRFIELSVYVYQCNGNYFGLMGNANGRSDDDFAGSSNRTNFASSSIFSPFDSKDFSRQTSAMEREQLAFLAKDFGRQFLVNDQISLFDYAFGQSSWTFYDPSFPREYITLGDLAQADRDRARRECEQRGVAFDDMAGCVLDLAHANIQPSPRPTQPDRTTGRVVTPVVNRQPNVNRPDVFERVPSVTNGRVPNSAPSESTPTRPITGTVDRTRVPSAEENTTFDRKPVDTARPATGNTKVNNSTIERPASSSSNSGFDRKPVGESGVTRTPNASVNTSTSHPSSTGATKTPERVSTPNRVTTPVPTSRPSTNTNSSVSRPINTGSVSREVKPASTPTQKVETPATINNNRTINSPGSMQRGR
ncbi:MAG: VWD domain-containing protein [Crocinitomicaceae bacterium]|nr:VWD domain-containing protein [Crocinitomicaceae bacterium]